MQQEAELKEFYVESLLKMQGSQFQRNGNKERTVRDNGNC